MMDFAGLLQGMLEDREWTDLTEAQQHAWYAVVFLVLALAFCVLNTIVDIGAAVVR